MAIKNRSKYAEAINLLRDFSIGNMRGQSFRKGEYPHTGMMSPEDSTRLKADSNANSLFVVFSYGTPIGWAALDTTESPPNWTIPEADYSSTTKNHKSVLRLATQSAH